MVEVSPTNNINFGEGYMMNEGDLNLQSAVIVKFLTVFACPMPTGGRCIGILNKYNDIIPSLGSHDF